MGTRERKPPPRDPGTWVEGSPDPLIEEQSPSATSMASPCPSLLPAYWVKPGGDECSREPGSRETFLPSHSGHYTTLSLTHLSHVIAVFQMFVEWNICGASLARNQPCFSLIKKDLALDVCSLVTYEADFRRGSGFPHVFPVPSKTILSVPESFNRVLFSVQLNKAMAFSSSRIPV